MTQKEQFKTKGHHDVFIFFYLGKKVSDIFYLIYISSLNLLLSYLDNIIFIFFATV